MACNCATTEQINALYEKYGHKNVINSTDSFAEKAKKVLMGIGVYAVMILLIPFIVLYVIYKGFFDDDKKISAAKFFRLKKKEENNVGYQQQVI